jgi:hypothetical protein
MSAYIDDIIQDIKNNPTSWEKCRTGITKGDIILVGYGNTKLLSITDCYIDGIKQPSTFKDRWKMEAIIGWWYRTVNLETMLK